MKKRKYIFVFLLAIFLFSNRVLADDMIKFRFLSEFDQKYISLPSDNITEYQIPDGENATYVNEKWYLVDVSKSGLVKMNTNENKGTATVTVKRKDGTSYDIIFEVIDYSYEYANKVLDEYVDKNIKDDMSDLEKMEKIGEYIKYKSYGSSPAYPTLVIAGAGDCIAHADTVVYMAKRAGIEAYRRYAGYDYFASSTYHRNTLAILDGEYYYIEGSYSNIDPPKPFDIVKLYNGFSTFKTVEKGTFYQYDAKEENVIVPEDAFYNRIFAKTFTNGLWSQNIKSIYIPKTITEIDIGAFIRTTSLEEINVAPDNPNYKSIDGVLYTKDGKTLIAYPIGKKDTSFIVPDGVEEIADYAFAYGTSETMPSSSLLNSEPNNVNLKHVDFPDSLKKIGNEAFYGVFLKNITIPKNVISIGDYAFNEINPYSGYFKILSKNITFGEKIVNTKSPIYGYDIDTYKDYFKFTYYNLIDENDSQKPITIDMISGLLETAPYNTNGTKQYGLVIKDGDYILKEGIDYILDYYNVNTTYLGATVRLYIIGISKYIGEHYYLYKMGRADATYELLNPIANYNETGTIPNFKVPDGISMSAIYIKFPNQDKYTYYGRELPVLVEPGTYSIKMDIAGKLYNRKSIEETFTIRTIEESKYLKGDLNDNNKIDLPDIIVALKKYLGLDQITNDELLIADMDSDGNLTLKDIIGLLKTYLGLN